MAHAQRGYGVLDPIANWLRGISNSAEDARGNPPKADPATERTAAAEPRRSGLRRVLADLWRLLLALLRQAALFIPLYSRIGRSRALDHDGRRRMLEAAHARPGAPLSELARDAGLHYKTALYHVRRLSSVELMQLKRDGKFLRAWPVAGAHEAPDLHGTKRRIVDLLRDGSPRTRTELAEAAGMTPQGMGLHLRALVSSGTIRAERSPSTPARRVYRLAA